MQWAEEEVDGEQRGFWRCPTPGCTGLGFGFDVFPIDPDYRDDQGRLIYRDDEQKDDDDETGGQPANGAESNNADL